MLYNKPVDDRKDDDEARVTIPRVQCQHDKDGECNLHGMGAKKMWDSDEEERPSNLLCV